MITKQLFEKNFVESVKDVVNAVLHPSPHVPPMAKRQPILLTGPVKHSGPEIIPGSRGDTLTIIEKGQIFDRSISHIKHHKLNECQFVGKFGKSLEQLGFGELYFVMGYKKAINETMFSRDALNMPIAYTLITYSVKSFLQTKREELPAVRYMLDPYNIYTIPLVMVKERHSKDPMYEEFMELLGKTATR